MSEPVVRVSQGFFAPNLAQSVAAKLDEGRATLEPALRALRGLLHYYVAINTVGDSMVNISVWENFEAASQMDTLKEMLALRDAFVALGVKFQPIRNYGGLWSLP